jgi:hypothetical protein
MLPSVGKALTTVRRQYAAVGRKMVDKPFVGLLLPLVGNMLPSVG